MDLLRDALPDPPLYRRLDLILPGYVFRRKSVDKKRERERESNLLSL
jgi:hypothetical protein